MFAVNGEDCVVPCCRTHPCGVAIKVEDAVVPRMGSGVHGTDDADLALPTEDRRRRMIILLVRCLMDCAGGRDWNAEDIAVSAMRRESEVFSAAVDGAGYYAAVSRSIYDMNRACRMGSAVAL